MSRAPPSPVVPALTGSLPERINQLADAVSRKADQTSEPFYSAVMLQAPDGTTYRVTVDNAGLLTATAVVR